MATNPHHNQVVWTRSDTPERWPAIVKSIPVAGMEGECCLKLLGRKGRGSERVDRTRHIQDFFIYIRNAARIPDNKKSNLKKAFAEAVAHIEEKGLQHLRDVLIAFQL